VAHDFAILSRSVSPDPEGTPLGVSFYAPFLYSYGSSSVHGTCFYATDRIREARLDAVLLHAAARRLQHAWQQTLARRVAAWMERVCVACTHIQRLTRGLLARRLSASEQTAVDEAWASFDEAGPLPIHWDWYYCEETAVRHFYNTTPAQALSTPVIIEGGVHHLPDFPYMYGGGLRDLTWPPNWPPAWAQRQRVKCGLPPLCEPEEVSDDSDDGYDPRDASLTAEQVTMRRACATSIHDLIRLGPRVGAGNALDGGVDGPWYDPWLGLKPARF
jgi:hypothetical protein